jgi:pyrroline-5-carboxylate reductase
MDRSLLLIGCGKMGGALLQGWLARGIAAGGVVVVEPAAAAAATLVGRAEVTRLASVDEVGAELRPAVVVFAVKPQQMDQATSGCARFASPDTVFLSIAAGKTIGYFAGKLGAGTAIVRAMPNTPAAVGRGIAVCCPNPLVTAAQRRQCRTLLEAVGEVEWVEDEALLDAVTAVSGGGPAYVFLLIEALAEAGAKAGLPADLAMRLSRATVSGSGELARLSDEPAAKLRQDVTSPGGTTLEALKILMAEDGVQPLFDKAIAAATRRSRELAS